MPNMRKCEQSGAIIFDLTSDEKEILDMKTELQSTLEEAKKILDQLKKKG